MARIGIFSLPMPSHINLFLALGEALTRRGHQVSFFGISDVASKIREAGFDFYPIDPDSMPPGSFASLTRNMGQRGSLAGMRLQGRFDELRYEAILEKGPELVRRAELAGIVVDQADACSGSLADAARLPWASVSSGLCMNIETALPPLFTSWSYSQSRFAVVRNALVNWGFKAAGVKTRQIINRYRRRWGLRPLTGINEAFSPFAQMSQQNAEFDFPRKELPRWFHYVGPIRSAVRRAVPFPWERLNGRPLIYASLGTVNQHPKIHQAIIRSCSGLDAQLVLSLGGAGNTEDIRDLPASAVVASFAPQVELLEGAALTITHGGLNTTLESLAAGVPLVAIPINFDQFGVAARIRWTGTGDFIKLGNLTPDRLTAAITNVLGEPRFRQAAKRMQKAIASTNGSQRAAEIIEQVIETRRPVLAI
jgi:zeaxanthin glucosyltransferase